MPLEDGKTELLERLFYEKYNRKLVGKELGVVFAMLSEYTWNQSDIVVNNTKLGSDRLRAHASQS